MLSAAEQILYFIHIQQNLYYYYYYYYSSSSSRSFLQNEKIENFADKFKIVSKKLDLVTTQEEEEIFHMVVDNHHFYLVNESIVLFYQEDSSNYPKIVRDSFMSRDT